MQRPSGLRRALARAAAGKSLDRDEAAILLAARGEALDELCAVAAGVRDAGLREAGRPGTVTYSRKVFIPLTRLCRDRCHYCTFATTPAKVDAPYLSLDEVLAIARAGAAAGCKEALFTLGDRPERRWPQAAQWLSEAGYGGTLEYVRAAAVAVLEETGLLPHLNPGVMSWEELVRLKPVAPSMGLMLESTADLEVHRGSPDKDPAVRLRCVEDAGRATHASGSERHPATASTRCSRSGRSHGSTGTCRRCWSRTSGPSPTPPFAMPTTPTATTTSRRSR